MKNQSKARGGESRTANVVFVLVQVVKERRKTTKEMTKEIEHQILPPFPKGQDAIYFGSFFFPLSWIPNAHE